MLLLGPSNLAVDTVLLEVVSHLEKQGLGKLIEDYKVLRFGYPKNNEILKYPKLLGSRKVDELTERISDLAEEIQQLQDIKAQDQEIAKKRALLLSLQEEVRGLVIDHISNCRIVATTTTLSYIDFDFGNNSYEESNPIANDLWDAVVIDEATMVPPAVHVFLASLSKKYFLLAGDPQQLSPVFKIDKHWERCKEWMGRDIFEKVGVVTGKDVEREVRLDDARLVRITSQRRCAPRIWSQVKPFYPEVEDLTDLPTINMLSSLPPESGQSLIVRDVSDRYDPDLVKANRVGKSSWENHYSANFIIKEFLSTIESESFSRLKNLSFGIITPYRAQSRLLKALVQERIESQIEVLIGTVHSFQGSEADVIFFDLVDGPPRDGLGRLLRGEDGFRLMNTAITRAKGKFFLFANMPWCQKVVTKDKNLLLWQLTNGAVQNDGQLIKIVELFKKKKITLEEATDLSGLDEDVFLSSL